ncbi:MAG: hypothetical protein Q8K65_00460 [Alphaproteobacteria bacterium]|nr:hypothetical protein [Alphaproteobacteria bacterium]
MHTGIHPPIDIRSGEMAELVFTVTDGAGAGIDLGGAAAEYRLARRAGERALLTLHSGEDGGVTIDSETVTVSLDTAALVQNGKAMLGDFFGQLRLTIGGRSLVAAEGNLCLHPIILPAEEEPV